MIYTERALQLRPVMEQAAQSLEDAVALTAVELFPLWVQLVTEQAQVEKGFRFQYGGKLYRTEQAEYTFADTWIPGSTGTESLFSAVDESHADTLEDPIPYEQNMEIFEGQYYSENGIMYLCTRSSGQPLYHALSSLTGIYVDQV